MIKNSSKFAISALALASSYPESAECKQESIKEADLDTSANLQLSMEESEMKHRKKHGNKHNKQNELRK